MTSGDPSGDALAAEARELYSISRADFIAARNARAAQLRKDGADALSAAVKGFVKPGAAADAVNVLSREEPALIERIVALGRQFRAAQSGADRDALRRLGKERNRLLSDAVERVRAAADTQSPAALDEIKQTVLAAVADPGAAVAVASGRLVRSLVSDGLSPVDLAGAVAGPAIEAPATEPGDERAPVDTSLALRRAKRELAAAEKAAQASARTREESETAAAKAEARRDEAERALAEATAAAERASAAAEQTRAEDAAARTRLRAARAALDDLG